MVLTPQRNIKDEIGRNFVWVLRCQQLSIINASIMSKTWIYKTSSSPSVSPSPSSDPEAGSRGKGPRASSGPLTSCFPRCETVQEKPINPPKPQLPKQPINKCIQVIPGHHTVCKLDFRMTRFKCFADLQDESEVQVV